MTGMDNKNYTNHITVRFWANYMTSVSFSFKGFGVNFYYLLQKSNSVIRIKFKVMMNFAKG